MLQFEELKLRLENIGPDIEELAGALGLAQAKRESAELDQKAAMDGFWDNMETAQAVTQRNAALKAKIEGYDRLVADYHDGIALIELADEEGDLSLLDECTQNVEHIEAELESQRLSTLLTGEYDGGRAGDSAAR